MLLQLASSIYEWMTSIFAKTDYNQIFYESLTEISDYCLSYTNSNVKYW